MLSRRIAERSLRTRETSRIMSYGLANEMQSHPTTSLHIQQQKRTFIFKALYRFAKRQMPKISKTEQIALGCGTIGKHRFEFDYKYF